MELERMRRWLLSGRAAGQRRADERMGGCHACMHAGLLGWVARARRARGDNGEEDARRWRGDVWMAPGLTGMAMVMAVVS
eukprot:scaffold3980_cov348-Prasinococcus_capsulatus_cf.AAC.12